MESKDASLSLQIEKMRKRSRRRLVVGFTMLLSAVLAPVLIYYGQYLVPNESVMVIFGVITVVAIIGAALTAYYGTGFGLLLHNLETLAKLAPPDPAIIGRMATLVKGDVYAVGGMASNIIMFVAFRESQEVQSGKTRLPRAIGIWRYNHVVGNLKVARLEGMYSVPIAKDLCMQGEGVLYAILSAGMGRARVPIEHSREALEQIMNAVAAEVFPYGSG